MKQVPEGLGALSGTPTDVAAMQRALMAHLDGLLRQMGFRVNRLVPKDGSEGMSQPLKLATFTVATRPTASSWTGSIIYVSDGGAGAVFQGSNGAAWVNLG